MDIIEKKVLILTGPGGSGKSVVAQLLVKNYGFKLVDGDNLDTEFFPKGHQWLPESSKNLKSAHDKIFRITKKIYNNGNNVVLEYIIFGNYLEFFDKFDREFGNSLIIKVLFPSQEETIKRDINRESWTTGVERIKSVRAEFEKIRNEIGENAFIDTSHQTPEETAKIIFQEIKSGKNK